jgi:hypothetical protein
MVYISTCCFPSTGGTWESVEMRSTGRTTRHGSYPLTSRCPPSPPVRSLPSLPARAPTARPSLSSACLAAPTTSTISSLRGSSRPTTSSRTPTISSNCSYLHQCYNRRSAHPTGSHPPSDRADRNSNDRSRMGTAPIPAHPANLALERAHFAYASYQVGPSTSTKPWWEVEPPLDFVPSALKGPMAPTPFHHRVKTPSYYASLVFHRPPRTAATYDLAAIEQTSRTIFCSMDKRASWLEWYLELAVWHFDLLVYGSNISQICSAYDASTTSTPDDRCALGVLSHLFNASIGWSIDSCEPYPLVISPRFYAEAVTEFGLTIDLIHGQRGYAATVLAELMTAPAASHPHMLRRMGVTSTSKPHLPWTARHGLLAPAPVPTIAQTPTLTTTQQSSSHPPIHQSTFYIGGDQGPRHPHPLGCKSRH